MKEDSSLRLCSLEGKVTRDGGCRPLLEVLLHRHHHSPICPFVVHRGQTTDELICWIVGILPDGRPNKTPFTFLTYFTSPLKAMFRSLMMFAFS